MKKEIEEYNLLSDKAELCNKLASLIDNNLKNAENKIWHAHPVWFLEGNPIVGYSREKKGIRLMFWSGSDFDEEDLNVRGGKFKDASIFYNSAEEIKTTDIKRWIEKYPQKRWSRPLQLPIPID